MTSFSNSRLYYSCNCLDICLYVKCLKFAFALNLHDFSEEKVRVCVKLKTIYEKVKLVFGLIGKCGCDS